jgi:hypothetical protein
MNRWWTAFGVGGWSPDGRFLLAGGGAIGYLHEAGRDRLHHK